MSPVNESKTKSDTCISGLFETSGFIPSVIPIKLDALREMSIEFKVKVDKKYSCPSPILKSLFGDLKHFKTISIKTFLGDC